MSQNEKKTIAKQKFQQKDYALAKCTTDDKDKKAEREREKKKEPEEADCYMISFK